MPLSLASTIGIAPGVDMPRLGLGTYKSAPDEVAAAVETALRHGYRSVDTASLYGNEASVGEGLRAAGLAREDIYVTTKVWNDEQGFDGTRAALRRSLDRLGLARVDLYLVHWPVERHLETTWRAMESLLAEGLTSAIGVCNFLPHHLDALLDIAEVVPAVDQVEFHPWLQQPDLQSYLAAHDIVLEAWAPIMRGRAGEEPVLAEIAKRHDVTPAQVALRWILQLGHVAIPKSVHEERIRENSDVFGFSLSESEVAAISAVDRGMRFGPDPNVYAWR